MDKELIIRLWYNYDKLEYQVLKNTINLEEKVFSIDKQNYTFHLIFTEIRSCIFLDYFTNNIAFYVQNNANTSTPSKINISFASKSDRENFFSKKDYQNLKDQLKQRNVKFTLVTNLFNLNNNIDGRF